MILKPEQVNISNIDDHIRDFKREMYNAGETPMLKMYWTPDKYEILEEFMKNSPYASDELEEGFNFMGVQHFIDNKDNICNQTI